jgi:hypothetical protein
MRHGDASISVVAGIASNAIGSEIAPVQRTHTSSSRQWQALDARHASSYPH